MNISRKVFAVLAMFTATGALASDYVQNEIIVKYKDGTIRAASAMNVMYQKVGVKKVRRYSGMMQGFEQLYLSDNVKVQDALAELYRNEAVEYAQPNYILTTQPVANAAPADDEPPLPGIPCLFPGIPFPPGCDESLPPIFDPGNGGGLPLPPPGGETPTRPEVGAPPADMDPPVADPELSKAYGLTNIGATEAWKDWRGDKKFVVAVIDTGIDYNHEDLSFNVWRNPNPTKGDVVGFDFVHNDGIPYDDQGHGTHTSGTVAAVGGNGKGVSGVSQRISVMGVKFLSAQGQGTTADAIRAIDYAVENGAKVLSNSWGGGADEGNKALYDSIERAKAKDVLFIAAAGNDGVDNDTSSRKSYPASFDNDNLISVAATDKDDKIAFFSNYGVKTTHLAAPGVNIYSTLPGNKYKAESGTSMACPHVAGAAALLWSKNPTWNYKKVKEVLLSSVDKIDALKTKTVTGGRLNVLKALQSKD